MRLKKPKFWDYKKPNLLSFLLYPIALITQIIRYFRNKIIKNENFKLKIICFGNIYVGGTGKTSLCIKLNKILKKKNIKSCFVKKSYKNQHDEQQLLSNNGKLFLERKRINAIKKAENEKYDVAILDDGLQDKSFNSDVKIVCFNNINWIGNGMTIPSGPLRENIKNLQNYDHVFLNGNLENLEKIKEKILSINSNINIHIGKYEAINMHEFEKNENYLVFSGIGNHESFITMIKNEGINVIKDLEFPDHYQYKDNDIEKIITDAKNLNCKIITTEKDFQRLKKFNSKEIKILKSEIKILNEEKFLESIL